MDISSFMSGNYLTHGDLSLPSQTWTITQANQQLVGDDQKICISFAEFPAKPFGLNKTNLRRIADLYGVDTSTWTGKQLQVYRSTTTYSGKVMQCIRVCGPQQTPPEVVCDSQGIAVPPAPPAALTSQQQPSVAAPSQQEPATAAEKAPWEADHVAIQQNSPPSV